MKFAIPPRLAVDADGYVWRIFDDEFSGELWSVATVNLDNSPTPEPVIFYEPVSQAETTAPCDRICREGDCPCDIPLLSERIRALAERWLAIPELPSQSVNAFNDGIKQAAREVLAELDR